MDRLMIAETGRAPGDLPERFGGYGSMMIDMLAPWIDGVETEIVKVYADEPLPPPRPGDGLLITGSPAGVYEDHPWIAPLEQSFRDYLDAGCKVVGICFGHQLMAQALGGRVEKSEKGWGVGVHTYDMLRPSAILPEASRFSCAVSHQDQVTALPQGAEVLAGSAFCPNGVIAYAGGHGLSFQMHPEFLPEFGQALLSARADRVPADVFALGQASYAGGSDREAMARWIAQFMKDDIQ